MWLRHCKRRPNSHTDLFFDIPAYTTAVSATQPQPTRVDLIEVVMQGGQPPSTIAKQLEALTTTQLPRNADCSINDWLKLTHRGNPGKQYILES